MTNLWNQENQLHKNAGHELLTLTADRRGNLRSVWLDPDGNRQSYLDLELTDGCFPSLAASLPETAWDEREIHDLFGWVPVGHPDLRPLIRTPRWPQDFLPLRNAQQPSTWLDAEPDLPALQVEGDGVTIMKVGPTHAGIIESGHFIFSIIGENILHLDAHLFQNHRGIEALLEGKTVFEVAPLVARICAADTVSNQTNWACAAEELIGFMPSEQILLQRIILLEAERVLSHLNDLAQIPAGVGYQVAHQRALAIKEHWQRSLQALFGHRFLFDTVHPGSAASAPAERVWDAVDELRRLWVPWRQVATGHHGFTNRMKGVGATPIDKVIRLGAQGVTSRAAGKSFDARQSIPWYQELFEGPAIRATGDVYARFMLRLDEVEASLKIMEKATKILGKAEPRNQPFAPPEDIDGRAVAFTESPHGLNVHDISFCKGRVSRYHVRAATYRNWPLLAQTVAGNAVADFPLINKSFELCYSCTDR